MTIGFSVQTRREDDDTSVVAFSGPVDLESVPRAEEALAAAEAGSPKRLIIDLRDVTFIDSTGLRLIIGADIRTRRNGTELALLRGPEPVHRVFRMTLMDHRLLFLDEPDGAEGTGSDG